MQSLSHLDEYYAESSNTITEIKGINFIGGGRACTQPSSCCYKYLATGFLIKSVYLYILSISVYIKSMQQQLTDSMFTNHCMFPVPPKQFSGCFLQWCPAISTSETGSHWVWLFSGNWTSSWNQPSLEYFSGISELIKEQWLTVLLNLGEIYCEVSQSEKGMKEASKYVNTGVTSVFWVYRPANAWWYNDM